MAENDMIRRNVSNGAAVSMGLKVGLGFLYVVIAVVIFAGNLLVVVAVSRFERLQTATNHFVRSLALADITVAVLVLPFSLVYDLTGSWPFDWVLCYFWRSCDITCCTASLLHLCCISVDRYWAITQPLTYTTRMSRTRVAAMISGVWLCSAAISFVPLYLGWFARDPTTLYLTTGTCDLDVNKTYALLSTTTSFYIPSVVMILSYIRILVIVRKQVRVINSTVPGADRPVTERKALKTLGIVIGVYMLSWLPFFAMYQIMSFCKTCQLSFVAISLITWLGYANSCMNPVIYAFMSKDFQWAFKKLLRLPIND